MGQGIGSSVYMIKSIVLHRSRIYDIVNDFSLAEGEWRVILIGCLVLLLVSVAQEIRERSGCQKDIRDWLMRQNWLFRWLAVGIAIACVVMFGVYGSGSTAAFIYEQF